MNNARDVSNAAVFTYATSKLDAAASLSASYRHDLYPPQNLGFISTAYTAAHEGMELLLKLYLKRGSGSDFNKIKSHDIGELFMLWDKEMRTNAELAYQKGVLEDIRKNRIFRAASQATLNLDRDGFLPPDYEERKMQYNEAFRQYKIKLLYEDSPTVRDVVRNLDAALGARNITWICKSAYASKVDGFPCEPEVWYPDDLLSMEWGQFSNLTQRGESLGFVEAFLRKEGSRNVFVGWRYLDEMTLEEANIVFRGPPAKMILMAQHLEGVVWHGIRGR